MKNSKLVLNIVFILFIGVLGVFSLNFNSQNKTEFSYIISDNYFGSIPKNIVYSKEPIKEIRKIVGEENVVSSMILFSEGEDVQGYVLFPNSSNGVDLIVDDKYIYFRIPSWSIQKDNLIDWKTKEGITIGTDINDVESFNKKPFAIAGYGWDYGGMTLGWNNGKLNPDLVLHFKLTKDISNLKNEFDKIGGGPSDIGSNNPALTLFNPVVKEMDITWKRN